MYYKMNIEASSHLCVSFLNQHVHGLVTAQGYGHSTMPYSAMQLLSQRAYQYFCKNKIIFITYIFKDIKYIFMLKCKYEETTVWYLLMNSRILYRM